MRSMSDQLLSLTPPLVAVLLAVLCVYPLKLGPWPLMPNIGMVMTLVVVALYPSAWPRSFAFALGLLQDLLYGTPLGSQALVLLVLTLTSEADARRQLLQPFHLRWLMVAGTLMVAHMLLWTLMQCVSPDATPLRMVLCAGLATALWYPLVYGIGKVFAQKV